MIISVENLRQYISTEEQDSVLEAKLQALETLIRKYTNNNFQKRGVRVECPVSSQKLLSDYALLGIGDTVQISQSIYNDGVYTVITKKDSFITLNADLTDESKVVATKVEYPADIVMGAVNMLKWDLENRSKVGVQSESISRHSVTYFNMDGDNSLIGYPKSLVGFLKPYMKARF